MLMVSPVEISFLDLLARDAKWRVDVGMPEEADGWIRGRAFERSQDGPFNDLLMRVMRRLRTEDRKTVAASFALRFGWAASVAIAPFLIDRCVPDVRLGNISIKFRDTTLFERTAVHEPTGVVLEGTCAPAVRSYPTTSASRGIVPGCGSCSLASRGDMRQLDAARRLSSGHTLVLEDDGRKRRRQRAGGRASDA